MITGFIHMTFFYYILFSSIAHNYLIPLILYNYCITHIDNHLFPGITIIILGFLGVIFTYPEVYRHIRNGGVNDIRIYITPTFSYMICFYSFVYDTILMFAIFMH